MDTTFMRRQAKEPRDEDAQEKESGLRHVGYAAAARA